MKQPEYRPRQQNGMALIAAILIAALVASLAFALSARERLWLTLINNRNDLTAAQSFALSAIDLARLTLRDDMRDNRADHLLEAWTIPIPPIDVEEGRVAGRITELQGRFNLYNLQSSGQVNPPAMLALQRLLSAHNLPVEWAEKMAQTIARQAMLWQKSQAQKSKQQTIGKILPIANLTELADLSGIEAEKLSELAPLVTILPGATNVNVNFVSPEVLMALTPGLSLNDAQRVVNRRTASYFKSTQEFIDSLPENLRASTKSSGYMVESQYFIVETESWYGRAHLRLQALVYRQRGTMPEIVWIRRE